VKVEPTIQSIDRAARILSSFTVSNPRLSLNDLTRSLGTTKATAHRYTMALREAKLLRYSERDTLFSLGPQVLTLASAARAGMPIIEAATPLMLELVHELGNTVVLSVWDGRTAVVVHTEESNDSVVQIGVRTGARLELEHSAQGRVFCAYLDPVQEPRVRDALAHSPELREQIDEVRARGVAINSMTLTGVRVIAAPVVTGERLLAALAVVGTASSVPEDHGSHMAIRLHEVADLIAAGMPAGTRS